MEVQLLAKTGVSGMTMTGMSLLGINLSGAEFGGTTGRYGWNYIYPNHADIDYYASKNLNVIRLPFRWERLQPTLGGALDSAELGRIQDIVAYAATKGMSVILDPHDFGAYNGNLIGSAQVPNAAFADFWGKLATQFKTASNVIFGLMNEPNQQSASTWLQSANAAIAAIRQSGAGQEILVPGSYWTGGSTWTTSDNAAVVGTGVVDPAHNYAFEIHEYLDAYASGTQSTVVSTTIGVDRLTAVTDWAAQNGARLFLGEFGVAQDSMSLTAMSNMLAYMSQHSDVWQGATYWGAGPWWGNYPYSIEPSNGVDKPQMGVLDQYAPGLYGASAASGSASLTAPAPAVTLQLVADTGVSAADRITSNPALGGGGDANATVHFAIDGIAVADTATADASGVWSKIFAGLADGQHTVVASETNAAGTTATPFTFTLDTMIATPTITSLGGAVANAAQTVVGTGEAGATVALFDGTARLGQTVTVGQNGTWSAQVTLPTLGANTITAQATDAAGNTATSAATLLTFDRPPVITSGGGAMTAIYNVAQGVRQVAVVSATDADAGDRVTYALLDARGNPVSRTGGFAIDPSTGSLSFTGATPAQGTYSITAMASDAFGGSALQTIKVNVGLPASQTALAAISGIGQTFAFGTTGDLSIRGFQATDTTSGGAVTPHSILSLAHLLFRGAYAGESGSAATALIASHSTQVGADTIISTDRHSAVTLQSVDRTALLAQAANFAFT